MRVSESCFNKSSFHNLCFSPHTCSMIMFFKINPTGCKRTLFIDEYSDNVISYPKRLHRLLSVAVSHWPPHIFIAQILIMYFSEWQKDKFTFICPSHLCSGAMVGWTNRGVDLSSFYVKSPINAFKTFCGFADQAVGVFMVRLHG